MNCEILLFYDYEEKKWVIEETITNFQYGFFKDKDAALKFSFLVSKALGRELIIRDKEVSIVVRENPLKLSMTQESLISS